jgi:hypothetical protein
MGNESVSKLSLINGRNEGSGSKINTPKEKKPQRSWTEISREHHSASTDRNIDH